MCWVLSIKTIKIADLRDVCVCVCVCVEKTCQYSRRNPTHTHISNQFKRSLQLLNFCYMFETQLLLLSAIQISSNASSFCSDASICILAAGGFYAFLMCVVLCKVDLREGRRANSFCWNSRDACRCTSIGRRCFYVGLEGFRW